MLWSSCTPKALLNDRRYNRRRMENSAENYRGANNKAPACGKRAISACCEQTGPML